MFKIKKLEDAKYFVENIREFTDNMNIYYFPPEDFSQDIYDEEGNYMYTDKFIEPEYILFSIYDHEVDGTLQPAKAKIHISGDGWFYKNYGNNWSNQGWTRISEPDVWCHKMRKQINKLLG
jgi:hypothetical protein